MTDMNDLVAPLKRELAVPGQFASTYPLTQDTDLLGSLFDGFGRVQLLGFLKTSTLDFDTEEVTPDLSPGAAALVILFAADSILTMRLLALNQRTLYEAGPVKYETEKAASTLTEILRVLRQRRAEILAMATGVGRSTTFAMVDAYAIRSNSDYAAFAHDEVYG